MKKLLSNKMRMLRPSDAFLPLAFLAGCFLGNTNALAEIFTCYLGIKLLALASSDGLRIAYAHQPSIRRVRGSTKMALLLQLAGAILCFGISLLFFHFPLESTSYISLGIGLLLNIKHVFYEYLSATNDGYSALLCRAITAVMLAAGFALKNQWFLLGTTGAATLVSTIIGLSIGGVLKGKLNAQVVRSAPRALLQTALYAAPGFAAAAYLVTIERNNIQFFSGTTEYIFPAFFAGLAIYSLCRTPFRRSRTEAKGLKIALIAIIGICAAIISAGFIPTIAGIMQGTTAEIWGILQNFSLFIGYAAVCGLILYGNISRGER